MAPGSRPAKRARKNPADADDHLDHDDLTETSADIASASHLVSFLTGYDTSRNDEDEDASGRRGRSTRRDRDDEDGGVGDDDGDEEEEDGFYRDEFDRENDRYEDDEDDVDEEDPDDDVGFGNARTPSRAAGARGKNGLVGLPSGSSPAGGRGSARGTPTAKRGRPPGSSTSTPRKTPGGKRAGAASTSAADGTGEGGLIRASRADAYFLLASKPARTSGSSYSTLVEPLSQAEYESFSNIARSGRRSATKPLVDRLLADAADPAVLDQWEAELEAGFNLLFYGFGSKRRALNCLVEDRLRQRGHCVVVNGHYPGTSIKELVGEVEVALDVPQDIPVPPNAATPLERAAHRLYAFFLPAEAVVAGKGGRAAAHRVADRPLYLVIHNIDAPGMRNPRSLAVLSMLACSPRIHLVASFDHVQTPLLFSSSASHTPKHSYAPGGWDGEVPRARGFNWLYHSLTTYDDYDLELSYQRLAASSHLAGLAGAAGAAGGPAGQGVGISEEGALQILRSVPPMALRLLKLVLMRQLASLPADPKTHVAHAPSMTAPAFAMDNDILQALAREKFIAREEERYDALMGEFRDHGLVVEAPVDPEGRTGRWVWVPLGKKAIERVVDAMPSVQV